jgi:dihydropteroate synthase
MESGAASTATSTTSPPDPWPHKTRIMAVFNATPDSFYAGSRVLNPADARRRGELAVADGADILDVGGESSRPGAEEIGGDEELRRVLPMLEALIPISCPISIDTYRAETARRALRLGAKMVNDITALRGDPAMASVVAEAGAECVLMHMQGLPKTMQIAPHYSDVVDDICAFFEERLRYATLEGVAEELIWLDPGFGFGKTVEHNLTMLRRLREFTRFGRPVLVGTSNKSTIGAELHTTVDERTEGTAATIALAIHNGAAGVRVHDVKTMARVARMCDAVLGRTPVD